MANKFHYLLSSFKSKRFVYYCFFCVQIFLCSSVIAEQREQSNTQELLDLSLEDLFNISIKSASLFPETDLDTGSTVTVINAQYWQDRGAKRLDDAMSYMPGFTPLPHFLGVKQWAIRGFVSSNGTGVQTLWDGVAINTYPVGTAQLDHSNIQLNTLDSIEVIRGPGSALYGADAFYGVVSLQAFESKKDINEASVRVGTSGFYEGAIKTSSVVFNNWRLNLALSTNGQPDQNEQYEYREPGNLKTSERDYNFNSYTTSVKLASNPDSKTAYKIGFYYNDNKQDSYFHDGVSVPSNDTSTNNSNLAMLKAETKWQLDSASSFVVDASYWTESHDFHRILSAANNKINIFVDQETQTSANLTYRNSNYLDNTELSMVLSHKNNDVKNAYRTITDVNGNETLNAALLFGNKNRRINSFLMDAKTFLFNRHYILRYGFRYDDYSDFGNYLTPRLGAIKMIDKTSAIKLLYGNAFRAPIGNELYGSPFINGNLDLEPEEIDTYELVYIKRNDKSKFESVLFTSKVRNAITTSGNNRINAFEKSATGIELSFSNQYKKLLLDVNGSYIDSKNDTINIDTTVFPKYIVNLGVGYKISKRWNLALNNRILLSVTKTPTTVTNSPDELPDYWRADLNNTINYSEKINIFINIRNIFDRNNYFPSISDTLQSDNFVTGIQDEGISLDSGVRIQF